MEQSFTTRSFCCLLGWSEPEAGVSMEKGPCVFHSWFPEKVCLAQIFTFPLQKYSTKNKYM